MDLKTIIIETIGWLAGLLVLGSYILNMKGKWAADGKPYIISNAVGGFLFVVFTYFHQAWPNLVLNGVWTFFAVQSYFKLKSNDTNSNR